MHLEAGMTIQSHSPTTHRSPGPSKPAVAGAKLCVVVGLDFTDADSPAFDKAARVAMRVPGSELHLVHVFHTAPSAERTRDLVAHLRLYVDEKAVINGIVGLMATGGSTNHTIHLVAVARAAGIVIDWSDFAELSGVVPIFGVCLGHQSTVELDCGALVKKSLNLLGSIGSSGGFERAIEIVQSRTPFVARMITRTVALADAETFFRDCLDREQNIKILIDLN